MSSSSKGPRKVLFLSSGETISRMFTTVIQELDQRDHRALVVDQDFYYGENSSQILETAGVLSRSLRDYGVYNVKSVLRRERPDLVVVGHAGGAVEMPFIATCKSLGIPTLLLQDGIIRLPSPLSLSDSVTLIFHMFSSLLRKPTAILRYLYLINSLGLRRFVQALTDWSQRSHIYAHERCTKAAAMGPYAKVVFTQLGYADEDVVITGQPRFDALTGKSTPRNVVCQELGIDDSNYILLVATPVFRNAEKRAIFVRAIARATKRIDGLAVVVKVHPREDPAPYQELLRREGATTISVVTDFPVPDLLHACDLFLSDYSTMTLEALLVGRPVILLSANGESASYPFDDVGVSVNVDNEQALEAAIREQLLDESAQAGLAAVRDRFILEHANGDDGQASQRVAALIGDLCPPHPRSSPELADLRAPA